MLCVQSSQFIPPHTLIITLYQRQSQQNLLQRSTGNKIGLLSANYFHLKPTGSNTLIPEKYYVIYSTNSNLISMAKLAFFENSQTESKTTIKNVKEVFLLDCVNLYPKLGNGTLKISWC